MARSLGCDDDRRRKRVAGHTGVGYSYAAGAAAALVSELLSRGGCRRGCAFAAGGVGSDAPRGAQHRLSGGRLERDLGGRCRAVGPEGTGCSGSPLARCWGGCASGCRCMAAAGSPPTPRSRCSASSPAGWQQGIGAVKMKVGSEPDRDPERVRHARGVIGDRVRVCSWTRTAPTRASRRWRSPRRSRERRGCRGLRSRSPPMTWRDCGCCATAPRRGWRSPRASTAMTSSTSGGCSTPARSTCCRRT